MKQIITIIFYLFTIPCFSQVEISLQQLRLLDLGDTDSNLGIHWGETSNNVFGLVYDGEGNVGNNVLHLREYIDASSNIMSFKADGRVGIGTQDPLFKTVIKATGNALNQDSVSIANLGLVLEKGSNTNNQGIGLGFQSSSGRSTVGAAILFERTGAASKGQLHFATKASTGANEDLPIRMTLDDIGNLGVGVTDPEWKTEIRATGNAMNGANVDISNLATVFSKGENLNNEGVGIGFQSSTSQGDVGAAIIHERTGAASEGKLHFATKTSNLNEADIPIRMTIDEDGLVGIGTLSPNATLHINDVLRLEPRASAPNCLDDNEEGRIYYDSGLKKLRVCVETGGGSSHSWVNLH